MEIRFDNSIRRISGSTNCIQMVPERSKMLPQVTIYKKENYYTVELEHDFREIMEEFDSYDIWDLDDEIFVGFFPNWCLAVSKEDLQKVYELFLEFEEKFNLCQSTREMAQGICTLIHSY